MSVQKKKNIANIYPMYITAAKMAIQYGTPRDRMVNGFPLPMQSMSITTNVVSSNPDQTKCTR